ncbi:MAG: XVIPCD domain-containing protein [Lysobacteraceae bacterium]
MSMAPRVPREERDPARLRELEDTRSLRLDIRDKRDDFHRQDPAQTEGIRRSPRTLADAEREPSVAPTRLAAAMDQPGSPDHALYLGSRSAVERMEAGLGRGYDANSEKLAQAATVLARQHGLERVDHVVLSIANGHGVRAGENLFVIQGRPEDPAHSRAVMKTDDALARTAGENEQKLAEAREQAALRTAVLEQERAQAASREQVARSVA